MASQLSGIAIILFIAFGSLTFVLLFIFAKRQIMRFALKSRRGPHVAVGSGAPNSFCREIERRLNAIAHIRCEPWLLSEEMKSQFQDASLVSEITPPHIYRMKVVDDVKELCNLIKTEKLPKSRHPQEDVFQYFVRLHKNNLFCNVDIQVLYRFLLLYEHARYKSEEFTFLQYSQFAHLLQIVKNDFLYSSNKSSNFTSSPKIVRGEDTELTDESTEPLPINSFSSPNSSLESRKFTHETAV